MAVLILLKVRRANGSVLQLSRSAATGYAGDPLTLTKALW